LVREIKLPGVGTAGGFGKEKEKLYFSFKLHHTGFYFSLDTATGTSVVYETKSRFQQREI
jgi:prolyl oligopeptidase